MKRVKLMKLKIGREDEYQIVNKISILIGNDKYILNERFGELEIHASNGHLLIQPMCANEVSISTKD